MTRHEKLEEEQMRLFREVAIAAARAGHADPREPATQVLNRHKVLFT